MFTKTQIEPIAKEAGMLLRVIDERIDLKQLRDFLKRVEQLTPSKKPAKYEVKYSSLK